MDKDLQAAIAGDARALARLFEDVRGPLTSYLNRLVMDRAVAEDLCQDTYLKCHEAIGKFRGDASFKTWAFKIATNIALSQLRSERAWDETIHSQVRAYAHEDPARFEALKATAAEEEAPDFIREHIDFCFSCIAKVLPIEEQLPLLLRDAYDLSLAEISSVLESSVIQVKNRLRKARQEMLRIFDRQCAFVNKSGACNQCSMLNNLFNSKQSTKEQLEQIRLAHDTEHGRHQRLYALRRELVRSVDPTASTSLKLHDLFAKYARQAARAAQPSR